MADGLCVFGPAAGFVESVSSQRAGNSVENLQAETHVQPWMAVGDTHEWVVLSLERRLWVRQLFVHNWQSREIEWQWKQLPGDEWTVLIPRHAVRPFARRAYTLNSPVQLRYLRVVVHSGGPASLFSIRAFGSSSPPKELTEPSEPTASTHVPPVPRKQCAPLPNFVRAPLPALDGLQALQGGAHTRLAGALHPSVPDPIAFANAAAYVHDRAVQLRHNVASIRSAFSDDVANLRAEQSRLQAALESSLQRRRELLCLLHQRERGFLYVHEGVVDPNDRDFETKISNAVAADLKSSDEPFLLHSAVTDFDFDTVAAAKSILTSAVSLHAQPRAAGLPDPTFSSLFWTSGGSSSPSSATGRALLPTHPSRCSLAALPFPPPAVAALCALESEHRQAHRAVGTAPASAADAGASADGAASSCHRRRPRVRRSPVPFDELMRRSHVDFCRRFRMFQAQLRDNSLPFPLIDVN